LISLRGDGRLTAQGYSNILTLRLKKESIESGATFGLHEDITTFRQGSLVPPSSAPDIMRPELLFATTEGRLGIMGELTDGATRILGDLQRNMDKYHIGPGGVEWRTWRKAGTELNKRDTAGFVDGDL
jgi:DNA damage-binding protein 1